MDSKSENRFLEGRSGNVLSWLGGGRKAWGRVRLAWRDKEVQGQRFSRFVITEQAESNEQE